MSNSVIDLIMDGHHFHTEPGPPQVEVMFCVKCKVRYPCGLILAARLKEHNARLAARGQKPVYMEAV